MEIFNIQRDIWVNHWFFGTRSIEHEDELDAVLLQIAESIAKMGHSAQGLRPNLCVQSSLVLKHYNPINPAVHRCILYSMNNS